MEKNLGFVQMPLERYDQLILENKKMMEELDNSVTLDEYNELKELLDSIVKIEAGWNDEPRLKIDFSKLATRLDEKFEQSEFAGKWTMKDLSNHKETVWDVFKEIK
jgi:predicted nuclease with TOPRIM domain